MRISECICNRTMMKKNMNFLTHLQEKLPLKSSKNMKKFYNSTSYFVARISNFFFTFHDATSHECKKIPSKKPSHVSTTNFVCFRFHSIIFLFNFVYILRVHSSIIYLIFRWLDHPKDVPEDDNCWRINCMLGRSEINYDVKFDTQGTFISWL